NQISKSTSSRYNTDGRGAYVRPDRPASAWGDGRVTGCKVIYQADEPMFMWEREEDFAITGPGVKTHVRKLDEAEYRMRAALQLLREKHPRITLKRAHARVTKV